MAYPDKAPPSLSMAAGQLSMVPCAVMFRRQMHPSLQRRIDMVDRFR
jgi:hypothetical protein